MHNFDASFIKVITEKLKQRLKRDLTKTEIDAFTVIRSGVAYEMIIYFISDENKTKAEIEKYVESVVGENKN
jgi:hypothetical protein